jgi:ribosomal protein S18 acetylase RimI-like enzyme
MADGWRAVEEEWLGDWLLRASSGFTGRGNSVLPLGDPVIDLAEALERVEGWYQARGLPPQFHIDIPSTGKVADDSLGSELLSAGYAVVAPTLVMTGATSDIQPLPGKAPEVTVSPSLTPAWLHAYARQRAIVPGITEKLLTGSAGQVFLSVVGGAGEVTAVARLSVHPGWAGLSGLWVDPGLRGRGLGRAVLQAAAVVARQQRLPSMFLQVEAANRAATALYESEGFRAHHTYVYLRRPA